jgi:hypothetical protein
MGRSAWTDMLFVLYTVWTDMEGFNAVPLLLSKQAESPSTVE